MVPHPNNCLDLEPVQFWKDESEAQACLKDWLERLSMRDWHIILKLTTEVPKDCLGYCTADFTHRFATIWVADKASERHKDNHIKTYQELILIHELLHCIIPRLENTEHKETIEEGWYNITLHQITERIARALYAAKYNLTQDWFLQ